MRVHKSQLEPHNFIWEPDFRFAGSALICMLRFEEFFLVAVQLKDTEDLPVNLRIFKII